MATAHCLSFAEEVNSITARLESLVFPCFMSCSACWSFYDLSSYSTSRRLIVTPKTQLRTCENLKHCKTSRSSFINLSCRVLARFNVKVLIKPPLELHFSTSAYIDRGTGENLHFIIRKVFYIFCFSLLLLSHSTLLLPEDALQSIK